MPTTTPTTLSQRRTTSRSTNLNKEKLTDPQTVDDSKSSPLKAFVWFLVIVLLAFVSYWGFKTYLTSDTDSSLSVTPTPILGSNSIVALNTLPDDLIAPLSDESYWNLEDKQIVSSTPDQDYTIESIVVQPHESYISFVFEVSGGDDNTFPQTTLENSDEGLDLQFESIISNGSLFKENEDVTINSNVVNSISRGVLDSNIDSYKIVKISDEKFALYSKIENDRKFVVVDVLKVAELEPTVLPTVSNTTPTPTTVTGENTQNVEGNATSNNVRISGYNYFDSPDKFTYNIVLEDAFPDATAVLSGDTLTLTVNQVGFDAIVGNGGSGSTDLAATGVNNVNSVDIKNENSTSTFVFTIVNPKGYTLTLDEAESLLIVEINN